MVTSMGITKKLKNLSYVQQLFDFCNFLFMYGVRISGISAETLWELKDIYDIFSR